MMQYVRMLLKGGLYSAHTYTDCAQDSQHTCIDSYLSHNHLLNPSATPVTHFQGWHSAVRSLIPALYVRAPRSTWK